MKINEPSIRMSKNDLGEYSLQVFTSPEKILLEIPLHTSNHELANKLANQLIACIVLAAGFSPTP